jgi:hypothetical protein
MCYRTDFALKHFIFIFLAQMGKKKFNPLQNKENKTIWTWMFAITYPKVICPSARSWSSKAKSDVDVKHAGNCQVMNWCIKIIAMQVRKRYQPCFNIFML